MQLPSPGGLLNNLTVIILLFIFYSDKIHLFWDFKSDKFYLFNLFVFEIFILSINERYIFKFY